VKVALAALAFAAAIAVLRAIILAFTAEWP
jgi:hypothetical protein